MATTKGSETRLTVSDAEGLLYREARLLDERRYEEWLELFTEDGLYWLPIPVEGEAPDPTSAISIIYDDAVRRSERVYRTLHTPVLDQNPPSRTIHAVSNVEVDPEPADGDVRVWCVQTISEMRPGGQRQNGLGEQRTFVARCEYHFREIDGSWRIALKKVSLLNADRPIYNLTFVV